MVYSVAVALGALGAGLCAFLIYDGWVAARSASVAAAIVAVTSTGALRAIWLKGDPSHPFVRASVCECYLFAQKRFSSPYRVSAF